MLSLARPSVLLASANPHLIAEIEPIISSIQLRVTTLSDTRQLFATLNSGSQSSTGLLLLDSRLPEVANGRLLAALSEPEIRSRWAIALLAEEISDEWIARLRESIIDDILPRSVNPAAWKMRLNTLERSHSLLREVEQLREASLLEVKRDALTGTLNRDTLLTVLFRETDRIQRNSGALALMAIDIDGFRCWNHELGRDAGDQLLREAARRITRLLRTYDVLGRIGGDEFLLILPGCSTVNAVTLAERLRIEAFGEPFWVRRGPQRSADAGKPDIAELRLTASYGITPSYGRSAVVALREVEQILRQAQKQQPDTILCSSGRQPGAIAAPQLFPEAETALSSR